MFAFAYDIVWFDVGGENLINKRKQISCVYNSFQKVSTDYDAIHWI